MSLMNKYDSPQPSTIIIKEVIRNPRTESFGDSVMNDFAAALGPATSITNAIYRRKANKAIEKRNCIVGTPSEYIYMLSSINSGDNYTVGGKTAEACFFRYIAHYCNTEIAATKRNRMIAETNPKIEEFLNNPPSLNSGNFTRTMQCNNILIRSFIDMITYKFKSRKVNA